MFFYRKYNRVAADRGFHMKKNPEIPWEYVEKNRTYIRRANDEERLIANRYQNYFAPLNVSIIIK